MHTQRQAVGPRVFKDLFTIVSRPVLSETWVGKGLKDKLYSHTQLTVRLSTPLLSTKVVLVQYVRVQCVTLLCYDSLCMNSSTWQLRGCSARGSERLLFQRTEQAREHRVVQSVVVTSCQV